MKYLSVFILLSMVLFSSCGNAPAAGSGGWSDSYIEMSDSGVVYDVWLMVRMKSGRCPDSLKMDVRITTPDGIGSAFDTFTMPVSRMKIDSIADDRIRYVSSEFSYDVESLYRTQVHPIQYGRWLISCRTEDSSVTGIRARVEKKEK